MERLNSWAAATEPALYSLGAATTEAHAQGWAAQERPPQGEARASQLEKSPGSHEDLVQSKINKIIC